MRTLTLHVALVAACLTVVASSIAAQLPGGTPNEDRLFWSVARLGPGGRIRVEARRVTLEGHFISVRRDSIVVDTHASGTRAAATRDVFSIWTHDRRVGQAIGRGVLIGAAAGAALGALVNGLQDDCDYCLNGWQWGMVLGVVPGTALGAVFGTIVGVSREPWRRVYP